MHGGYIHSNEKNILTYVHGLAFADKYIDTYIHTYETMKETMSVTLPGTI